MSIEEIKAWRDIITTAVAIVCFTYWFTRR